MPISELIAEVLDGRNSHLTNGVQQALGRPPRDFADFARDAAATGVWNLEGADQRVCSRILTLDPAGSRHVN